MCLAYGQRQRACAWSQVHGVLKQGEQRNKCATTTAPRATTRHATTRHTTTRHAATLHSPCHYFGARHAATYLALAMQVRGEQAGGGALRLARPAEHGEI